MSADGLWWLRFRASARDESPFPDGFLEILATESRAALKRARRARRLVRRVLTKESAS